MLSSIPPTTDKVAPGLAAAASPTALSDIQEYQGSDGPESLQHDNNDDDSEYPEGGTAAWSVVLGAWCALIPSMGLLNTVGVLQAWVSENQLHGYSESTIGWIFSAYAFFLYIGGAQVGECFENEPFSTLHLAD